MGTTTKVLRLCRGLCLLAVVSAAAKAGAPGAVPLSERKLEPVKEKKGTVRASFGGLSRRAKPKK